MPEENGSQAGQGNAAPAQAAPAPAAPADSFQGLEVPGAPTPAEPGSGAGAGTPGDEPKVGTQGKEPAAKPPEPTPARVFAGRFKTVEELETAYDESGREARRLHERTLEFEQKEKEFSASKEDLEARIKAGNVGFTKLSDVDLAKLKENDIGAYTDYVLARDKQERAEAGAQNEREARRSSEEKEVGRVKDSIRGQIREMTSKPTHFPQYQELQPTMSRILELAPEAAGYEWTPKIAYYAAMGLQHLATLRRANGASEESRAGAAAQAAAAASQSGSTGAGGGAPLPSGGQMDDLNAAIVGGAPKKLFT